MTQDQPTIPSGSTAVVMNDMINANLRSGAEAKVSLIAQSQIIERTASLVEAARQRSLPIFWIQVERRPDKADMANVITDQTLAGVSGHAQPTIAGSWEAQNVDELAVASEDWVIVKPRFNPFIGTNLDLMLRTKAIDTILLGGYSTTVGVESCARTARDLNYNVVVLSDCCYGVPDDIHFWSLEKIMPKYARVMTSDEALTLLR